jgi:DNA helicase-2/ATP-dependent DNA helicase PcrA
MDWKLNCFQEEAVKHVNGPCLVTSCPGSGKTFVIVERVVALIKSGVPQKNILCLTFTNKAANEMKERICKRLQVSSTDFFIGTFHSLCAKFLRKIGHHSGYSPDFNILDDRDQTDLILQVARRMNVDLKWDQCERIAYKVNYFRDQLQEDEWLKASFTTDIEFNIADGYLNRCKHNNCIDFSGLIYETIKIIEREEELRQRMQNTFKYILVDETQDTNRSQFRLVTLLGDKYKNIMLIGDIDQSVYGWRGARYQNIRDFMDLYDGCRNICLSKNYRSTPQIIKVANKLICHNLSHLPVPFETDNAGGEPVRCFRFDDQIQEADWVGKTITQLINEGGWSPSDMVVLYRVNKMSEPIEQSLARRKIPYDVIGSWSFYDRREIRDCLSMVKVLINSKDGIAFHRAAKLLPGMGDTTIGKIENLASEKNITLIEACKETSRTARSINIKNACNRLCDIYSQRWDFSKPAECFSRLIEAFDYSKYLNEKFQSDSLERLDCVQQVIDSSGIYEGVEGGLSEYLQQISLVTSSDEKNEEDDKVSLMSLHAVKGLEFPIVFMIGVEHDILPHKNAVAGDPFEGMEEERRLCYVGITRAKKLLYVTFCKSRKQFTKFGMRDVKAKPSQFLIESGLIKENT